MKILKLWKFLKEFKKDEFTTHYKTEEGLVVFRTFAQFQWYLLKCQQAGFRVSFNCEENHYEAISHNKKYGMAFVEGDVLLSKNI